MTIRLFILVLASTFSSITAFAQGQLVFNNAGSVANAPVYEIDGVPILAGSRFQADLYWAPGIVTDSAALTALRQPAGLVGCLSLGRCPVVDPGWIMGVFQAFRFQHHWLWY